MTIEIKENEEVTPKGSITTKTREVLANKLTKETIKVGFLDELDRAYIEDLKKQDPKNEIHDKDQAYQYFAVKSEASENLGVVGIYHTDQDKNLIHLVVDPKYRGRGLARQFYDGIMAEMNLPFVTITIDYDPYHPNDPSFSSQSSIRAAEKLPGVERVADPHYGNLGKAKFIYRRTTEENNPRIIATRKLIELREKIAQGELKGKTSDQIDEEFRSILHQTRDRDLVFQILGSNHLTEYFRALNDVGIYTFILPVEGYIEEYVDYAFSPYPANRILDSLKRPLNPAQVNIFVSHCIHTPNFILSVIEAFSKERLDLILKQIVVAYPVSEKALSKLFGLT